jgi:hypothetical protein
MTALIFAPDLGNQYREFHREAKRAALFWGASIHYFPALKSPVVRRRFVVNVIRTKREKPISRVAFLCHGFRNHLQAGFDMATASGLAAALRENAEIGMTLSLYCCSTGRSSRDDGAGPYIDGEDSFADRLRDELVAVGFYGSHMLTHRTPGHLARNPDVRVFRVDRAALGGDDVALRYPLNPKASEAERTAAWDLYRRFRGLLHTPNGRWEIADLEKAEIERRAALCAPYVAPPKNPI